MAQPVGDEFLSATMPCLDMVHNIARRCVRAADVDDLAQETYLRAFEAWRVGRKPRRVAPWLATICLNTARNWARRPPAAKELLGAVQEEAAAEDVEHEALEAVRRERVHRAMWELPEEQRIAVTLMDLAELSSPEVARITRAPRGTVLARVHRGRKRLARLLEGEMSTHEA